MKFSFKIALSLLLCSQLFFSCQDEKSTQNDEDLYISLGKSSFPYMVEQFADLKILRYELTGWENLTLNEQKLVYFLTQADNYKNLLL